MLKTKGPLFDTERARSTIEKGRRKTWWRRTGNTSRTFKYLDQQGNAVRDKDAIQRIRSLVIPPAWQFVRINPFAAGKIQAVGMDSTGRVQYIYHPTFSARQKKNKFARMERFGAMLPKLREATNRDIALEGLPREKVLAVVMRLINSLYFRVGTDHSARHYKTFGITTLQKRHLTRGNKGKLSFQFVGKSHIEHRKVIVDEELAAIVKELLNIKRGRKLFRYLSEDGKPRPVTPSQINAYIKAATGPEFSSKDFRTWGATVLTAAELAIAGVADTETEKKRRMVSVIKRVAEELGNTPAVCRESYVHPTVLKAYAAGTTIDEFRPRADRRIKRKAEDLDPEEKAVMRLLQSYGR